MDLIFFTLGGNLSHSKEMVYLFLLFFMLLTYNTHACSLKSSKEFVNNEKQVPKRIIFKRKNIHL